MSSAPPLIERLGSRPQAVSAAGPRARQPLVHGPGALASLADGPDDQGLTPAHVARGEDPGDRDLVGPDPTKIPIGRITEDVDEPGVVLFR